MKTLSFDYDYIIVGSGFGGSVSALRLSQKGYKVLVIEKGKWYRSEDFPKTNWNLRKWLWLPLLRCFGIMKISLFRNISVLSGTGVGGGSLVYANTLPVPKRSFYKTGSWAGLVDWETELKPYYREALRMLGATESPKIFEADQALETLAKEIGREMHFERPKLAVYFGEKNQTGIDPYFGGKGPERSGCVFCGGCMTGCRHNAKNTLDKNYLHLAQLEGAEILAEHKVTGVVPLDETQEGYSVAFRKSTAVFSREKSLNARSVIFSGGVTGTLKLLLKLKETTLSKLSDRLGDDIRTNNETLVSVSTLDRERNLSKGVAIGSMLHTDENSHLEICRYAEGSGFWKFSHWPYAVGKNTAVRLARTLGVFLKSPWRYLKVFLGQAWARHTVVLLFMQSLNSTLRIRRNRLGLLVSGVSQGEKPSPNIPESAALTEKYSRIVNGQATSFVLETLAGIPSTAHILGGAVMGRNASEGVIDKDNRLFGYKNLYVVDGAMISANPGVNPSLSIAALAE
ncbi:MAG: GMC oxidoreductase, partial [Cytophagales bacterium]|nr:GMC oxidoreductase [Cytophagales bacterium]